MDATLTQLLAGMFQMSQENDALRARVRALENEGRQHVEEIRAVLDYANHGTIPEGWRLVKDT